MLECAGLEFMDSGMKNVAQNAVTSWDWTKIRCICAPSGDWMPTGLFREFLPWLGPEVETVRSAVKTLLKAQRGYPHDVSIGQLEWLEWCSHRRFCKPNESGDNSGPCQVGRPQIWHKYNGRQKVSLSKCMAPSIHNEQCVIALDVAPFTAWQLFSRWLRAC